MRAIVVGAGVAGLTAARDMHRAGLEVLVIEARDRIGGRTWTADVGGVPVDLGGSWIHGPFGNPLSAEVEAAGWDWKNDGSWGMGLSVFIEGQGWAPAHVASSLVATQADFDGDEATAALGDDASYSAAAEWYVEDRRLSGDARRVARFGIEWLEAGLNIGGLPEVASVSGCACYHLHPGGNAVISGGYIRLVDSLADGLEIQTGSPVLSVEHGAEVIVSTERGSHRADRVVVAVPLTIIQRGAILFDPPLPRYQLAASRLAMASLEKVVFRFDDHFWPDHGRRMTFVSDDRRFPTWIDMSHHTGAPTLVAFYNPKATPGLTDRPLDERARMALGVLKTMLPGCPDPVAVRCTDWLNDQLALGSYSYVPIGATPNDMRTLGTPASNALFFAGEHTVPESFGTVHGAYVSGRRAAAAVLA
ncbi:MAG: FAD-dependent oxidoreductase [Acidimicrobiia bacterium]|nr:FAD-dependent oxidoreductase [Acidimicrobiia bacterium]